MTQKINELAQGKEYGDLLGEIITWTPPTKVDVSTLRTAMSGAGIDLKFLNKMMPKSAFTRACKKLVDKRVIEKTHEDDNVIYFQFTQKHLDANQSRIDYQYETIVGIDKKNGNVICENEQIKMVTQQLLQEELNNRNAIDVTRMVQKVIEDNGDIFPLRERGGVYFVPGKFKETIDKIDDLFTRIGGCLNRFRVDHDNGRNEAGAADAIFGKLAALNDEFNQSMKEFDGKITERRSVLLTKKIKNLKVKLKLYRTLLLDKADGLEDMIKRSEQEMKHQIKMLALGKRVRNQDAEGESETGTLDVKQSDLPVQQEEPQQEVDQATESETPNLLNMEEPANEENKELNDEPVTIDGNGVNELLDSVQKTLDGVTGNQGNEAVCIPGTPEDLNNAIENLLQKFQK